MKKNKKLQDYIYLQAFYEVMKNIAPNQIEKSTEKDFYFHYTSTEVLDKILSYGCLRASNIHYLNDSREYYDGVEGLLNLFDDERKKLFGLNQMMLNNGSSWLGLYTISFSQKEDALHSWTTYAKESGVCIEMDSEAIHSNEFMLAEKINDEYSPISDRGSCFYKIFYRDKNAKLKTNAKKIMNAFYAAYLQSTIDKHRNDKQEEDAIKKAISQNKELFIQFIQLIASYVKTRYFKDEAETRISVYPLLDLMQERISEIKYQSCPNGVLRPFLEIYFLRGSDPIPKCPIINITIGPSKNQQIVFDSVTHRIQYGDNHIWNWSDEKKQKQLNKFVDKGISIFKEEHKDAIECNISIGLIEIILAESIIKTLDYDISYKIDNRLNSFKVYLKGDIIEFRHKGEKEDKQSINPHIRSIIDKFVTQYLRNNSFTKSGIIITKSSNPYIF